MPAKFPSAPAFVLHCRGAVTELKKLRFGEESVIAVGTQEGVVLFYDPDDFHLREVVYESPKKSSIQSIIPLGNDSLLIHVRGVAVIVFMRIDEKCLERGSIPITFPGFCSLSVLDNRILLPVTKDSANIVQLADLDDCLISLTNSTYVPLATENVTPTCSLADSGLFYVGDDMGKVTILSANKKMKEVDMCKTPIFALACSSRHLAAGSSAESPLFLIEKDDFTVESSNQISFIQKAGGVSSLCFSPTGSTLFGGFWDGIIRAFAVKTRQIVLVLPFHSDSVTGLLWLGDKRLAASSKDGKVTFWVVQ